MPRGNRGARAGGLAGRRARRPQQDPKRPALRIWEMHLLFRRIKILDFFNALKDLLFAIYVWLIKRIYRSASAIVAA